MPRLAAFLVPSVLTCSLLIGQTSPQPQPQALALTHVTVIDVTGGPALPDSTVVVTGNRITTIGATGKVTVPKDAQLIDSSGKFLIPGLWDMHVHWDEKDYLPLFIANGVTGVRQMSGFPGLRELREQVDNESLLGPHMFIASPIVDGPKPFWPNGISVGTETEARSVVAQVKQNGADFVKVYSFLPRQIYFAIADESKKQGIPFAGHIPFGVSIEEASDAGQKSIEHLIGILDSCSSHAEELHKIALDDLADMIATGKPDLTGGPRILAQRSLPLDTYSADRCARVLALLKRNGTWICPTLALFHTMAHVDDPELLKDSRSKYMPRWEREYWSLKNNFLLKMAALDPGFMKKQFQLDLSVVAQMERAGVGLLAGTDMTVPFGLPGFGLHDELALYVQAGLTPLAALRTATYNPARFLGRESEIGTVERGKIGDLVLLDANPLRDIRNTTKIAAVVYQGKFYPRILLDAILAHAEALASRKSVAEALSKTIETQGVEAAAQQYHGLKMAQPDAYDFSEAELNMLGYQLLQAKKLKEAIRIFQLNVEAYPQSGNVYDSLAEAYMDNGEIELAITNYRKSQQLDPANKNAVEMLKKLTVP